MTVDDVDATLDRIGHLLTLEVVDSLRSRLSVNNTVNSVNLTVALDGETEGISTCRCTCSHIEASVLDGHRRVNTVEVATAEDVVATICIGLWNSDSLVCSYKRAVACCASGLVHRPQTQSIGRRCRFV